MISILSNDYSLSNILMICIQLIIPVILYLISFEYISDSQQNWYEHLKVVSNIKLIAGYKGMFLGSIAYFFSGVASIIILDYYYNKSFMRNNGGVKSNLKQFFKKMYDQSPKWYGNIHFYLFPLMFLLSNIGFPIAFQSKTFIPHLIFMFMACLINIGLIFFYYYEISYIVSLFLLPLLFWQVLNIATFITGDVSLTS
jgi:hypothetical protein